MPRFRSKKLLIVMIAAIISIAWFGVAKAFFNPQINYQGKLTNSSDVAVTDGTYNMQFKLCSDPGCTTELWSEVRTSTNKVQVTNGLFSVMLGEVATTSLTTVDFNQDIYLELQVGGTGTPSFEILLPRKRFGSMPNAFNSARLGGKFESQFSTLAENETITGAWNFNNILSITANSSSPALSILQSGTGTGISVGNGVATTTIYGAATSTFPYGATFATTGGNVGIGMTNPAYKLHIKDVGILTSIAVQNDASGSYSEINTINNGGTALDRAYIGVGGTGTNDIFANRGYFVSASNLAGLNIVAGKSTADIKIFTGGTAASNERMRIDSAGNVGIGTTTPQSILDVYSTKAGGDTLSFKNANTADFMYVGITNNSNKQLALIAYGDTQSGTMFGNNRGGATVVLGFNNPTSLLIGTLGDQPVVLGRNNLEAMRVGASNKIGIGTTVPDKALEINSSDGTNLRLTYNDNNGAAANYTDFSVGSDGALTVSTTNNATTTIVNGLVVNTNTLVVTKAGNVGIGTLNPAYSLDVAGNIRTTGQMLLSNGTSTAPSLIFSSATGTGIFLSATDTVGHAFAGRTGYTEAGFDIGTTGGRGVQFTNTSWAGGSTAWVFNTTANNGNGSDQLFNIRRANADIFYINASGAISTAGSGFTNYIGGADYTFGMGQGGSYNFSGTGGIKVTQIAQTSGARNALLVTSGIHTGLTTLTEVSSAKFDFSSNKTWAAGAGTLATQREFSVLAPTYNGSSTIPFTMTNAATFAISGAPIQGTGITITNPLALWVQSGKSRFDGDLSVTGFVGINTTSPTNDFTVSGNGYFATKKEGFEGASVPPSGYSASGYNSTWRTTSTNPYAGSLSLETPVSADNSSSTLSTTAFFSASTTVSFWWKVSSEPGFDFFGFCIDRPTCNVGSNQTDYDFRISSTSDWAQVTSTVSPGLHTFKWQYAKDNSVSAGSDAGFLDEVNIGEGGKMVLENSLRVNGNILVNTSTAGSAGYKIMVDSGSSDGAGIGVNGYIKASGFITGTTTLDLAETYPFDLSCVANGTCPVNGDLVCADSLLSTGVKKCSATSTESILGVVSTNPGFLLGGSEFGDLQATNTAKIALSGRVPVKVNITSGTIKIGDELAIGAIDGTTQKALEPGQIIGVALENFGKENEPYPQTGTVLVFVNPHWSIGSLEAKDIPNDLPDFTTTMPSILDKFTLAIENSLQKLGLVIKNGVAKLKELFVDKIFTKQLCVGETCIGEQQLKDMLQNAQVSPTVQTAPLVNTQSFLPPAVLSDTTSTPIIESSTTTTTTTTTTTVFEAPLQVVPIEPTTTTVITTVTSSI